MYPVDPQGAGVRGYVCARRETFSRTTAVLDSYFLVADIKMDGLNMRRADGTATIAFETPGAMQDSEARWRRLLRGERRRARDQATFEDV